MIIGFIIWSIVFLVILGIGIWSWHSGKAVGFFSGVKPPEVTDVRRYNRSVATLWFVYAALFESLGIPLLFLKQNSPGFIPVIFSVPALLIAMMIAYIRIEGKYRV